MPLFEYECRDCKARFERLTYNNDVEVTCRSCGGVHVTQLISTFAVAGTTDRPAARELGPCGSCGAAQRGMCGVD